jgi:protein phosphatase
VAITFDVGLDEAQMRAAAEGSPPSRSAHAHLIQAVRDYRPGKDGFRRFWRLERGEAETATVGRAPLPMDRRSDRGPFDVVGDVHGCADELVDLLRKLGYEVSFSGGKAKLLAPHGRKVVLLGDLVDRGPKTPDALRIAMAVAEAGGYVVKGNHEHKLHRALTGHTVALNNGLTRSIEQISAEPPAFRKTACDFIDGLLTHYWLDGGNLAVAHAGVTAEMLGRSSLTVDQFNLYGFPTGETDAATGAPARKDWALGYDGAPHVVYGHTAHLEPEWVNRTLCVDTGCVFGGELTALRWPENELVSVPARQVYSPYHGTLTTRRDQLPQDRAGTPSI